jgi:predicted nucleic acid-binding protein
VAEVPPERGLLDTSVVIDLDSLDPALLPAELAISALTLAELAAGPHATDDRAERARRQERLQRIEVGIEALPFDDACARVYGRVFAAVASVGRKTRGPRPVDLLIAVTAITHDLPLFTRNAGDLRGIENLLEIIDPGSPG